MMKTNNLLPQGRFKVSDETMTQLNVTGLVSSTPTVCGFRLNLPLLFARETPEEQNAVAAWLRGSVGFPRHHDK